MSLEKGKGKYRQEIVKKTVTISGNEHDIEALTKVIQETERMFNIDLQKRDADYPARITISDNVEPEAVMYPRTAAYLSRLKRRLKGDTTPVGTAPLNLLGERSTYPKDGIVNVMEYILWGTQANKGKLSRTNSKRTYLSMITQLDKIIRNPAFAQKKMLSKLEPEMVHISTLNTHQGIGVTEGEKTSLHQMLNLDVAKKDYPADMGAGYNQGYVVMLRTKEVLPMSTPTGIKDKDWKSLLRDMQINKGELHAQYKRTPKTVGELMNFIFAYTAGQTMKMDESLVVPFARNRFPIETELLQGSGKETDFVTKEVDGYRYLHKAVVVGKGPFRVGKFVGSGKNKAPNLNVLKIDEVPGFYM